MAERFLPLLLLLLSSNQAFLACLNKACLPGRGRIPLWPFALWPKVHSICKVRNSSEVQLMGLRVFFFSSSSFLDSAPALAPVEGWKTSSVYTHRVRRWVMEEVSSLSVAVRKKKKNNLYPATSRSQLGRRHQTSTANPVASWPIDLMGDVVVEVWRFWGSGA